MGKPKQKFNVGNETTADAQANLSKKRFTRHDLNAFYDPTPPQQKFIDAWNSGKRIIINDGDAGTGKSAVSLYHMLYDVFSEDKSTRPRKVLIIRSAVSTRDQGFLPGEQEDKDAVYAEPYRELTNELIKYNNPYDNLVALGLLQFKTSGNLRGLTWDYSVVLVDEFQNMDFDELMTVVTRCGKNTRIVFCGDTLQNDLKRTREISGKAEFLAVLNEVNNDDDAKRGDSVEFIQYGEDDIVRDGIVKRIIKARNRLTKQRDLVEAKAKAESEQYKVKQPKEKNK